MVALATHLKFTSTMAWHIERMIYMLWLMCCPKGQFEAYNMQHERLIIWRKQSLR
jgi:hypothetical protein